MKWLLLTAALLAGYLLTGVAQVRPGERAVVRRFGAVVARPGPGLYVGLPWPCERVDCVPVGYLRRVRVGYVPETEEERLAAGHLLTGDQNLINVAAVVDYAVRDDDAALDEFVAHRDRVDALVARAAETALGEWAAGRPIDEALLAGKEELRRRLGRRVQEQLDPYRLGVEVRAAEVDQLAPPDEVKPDFDNVTKAQTAIRTREQEARQEAQRRLQAAAAEKYEREQRVIGYAFAQRALAVTDANAFADRLAQYRAARAANPDALVATWWAEMRPVFQRLREAGRLDLLDERLGADGLDVTQFAPKGRRR